jgi:molybdopterin converting factor small subunit
MVIKCQVKFYGIIADIIGKNEEKIEFSGFVPTLNDIKLLLEKAAPDCKEVTYLFAVNQAIVSDLNLKLKESDEIALLPAFSGG